jgi:hypothetical protein
MALHCAWQVDADGLAESPWRLERVRQLNTTLKLIDGTAPAGNMMSQSQLEPPRQGPHWTHANRFVSLIVDQNIK